MNTFFASHNTCRGFVSRFDEIFDESRLERLYIIKGGPGTGKSRLLRMIAEKWGSADASTELFACSSDPDSLDGVLSPVKNRAAVDGTAPHCADPRFPGAVGKIVNTGDFWNENVLAASAGAIISLSEKKSACFSRAYKLLGACRTLLESAREAALEGFDREKMESAAKRLAAAIGGTPGERRIRLTSTFNHLGQQKLDSFEKPADTRVLVTDVFGTGHLFTEELLRLLDKNGTAFTVSYSPIDGRPDGLFIPGSAVSVTRDVREDWEKRLGFADKYVNMDRFLDRSVRKADRRKLRFALKCAESLKNAAVGEFRTARELHSQLEEIYGSAMDFKALTDFQHEIAGAL